jgi:hypothetical protein
LFFKVFFARKCIKIIFLFLKIICDIYKHIKTIQKHKKKQKLKKKPKSSIANPPNPWLGSSRWNYRKKTQKNHKLKFPIDKTSIFYVFSHFVSWEFDLCDLVSNEKKRIEFTRSICQSRDLEYKTGITSSKKKKKKSWNSIHIQYNIEWWN